MTVFWRNILMISGKIIFLHSREKIWKNSATILFQSIFAFIKSHLTDFINLKEQKPVGDWTLGLVSSQIESNQLLTSHKWSSLKKNYQTHTSSYVSVPGLLMNISPRFEAWEARFVKLEWWYWCCLRTHRVDQIVSRMLKVSHLEDCVSRWDLPLFLEENWQDDHAGFTWPRENYWKIMEEREMQQGCSYKPNTWHPKKPEQLWIRSQTNKLFRMI